MKRAAWVALAVFVGGVGLAYADQALIQEVEGLRNSLPAQDPTRPTLTLRLADLLYQQIGEIGRGHDPMPDEQGRISRLQARAVTEYESALGGEGGLFKPLSGARRLKVQFQLARLYSDMNEQDRALPLWKLLVSQSQLPELEREAALRLAEKAEGERDYATSETYYLKAISLCDGTDLCSYAHYRRAWMLKDQGKLDDAISEIQLALWDSRGQVREEALRDLVSFLGEHASDGHAETALVEKLMGRINRPSLLADLAAAFFAAGNREGGVYALALVDSRQPSVKSKIRLLEEYYGLKRWDAFRATLDALEGPATAKDLDVESEKILKRLTVQLDGERASQPRYTRDFERAVELHLALFPTHPDTLKMMEGWLAAEPDAASRAAMIQRWLHQPAFRLTIPAQVELHEARASIGQKTKDDRMVAEEMQALFALSADPAKRREYRYIYGRALDGLKRFDEALPVFRELAAVGSGTKPDRWAIQSQNETLNLLAQKKDYDGLVAQTSAWTDSGSLQAEGRADPALAGTLADMAAIGEKARFQKAVSGGNSPASLKVFLDYCSEKKLLPQSCENAKVLAVHLRDESALLAVLAAQGAPELAAEDEAAGYFAESAALLEKRLTPMSPLKDRLKVALLYELGHDLAGRDRVLEELIHAMKGRRSLGELEDLYFVTLKDASLLSEKELGLDWSPLNRARLAELIEEQGHGSSRTRKILLESPQSTGPKWSAAILGELDKLESQESRIRFYGARSRMKFGLRLNALKRMVVFGERYLAAADTRTRDGILGRLQQAHLDLADAILKTPIPASVQGDQAKQLSAALAKMAEPFQDKAKAYAGLIRKDTSSDQLAVSQAAPAPRISREQALARLHRNPTDLGALAALRDFYEAAGQSRLAAYFKGRIIQAQGQTQGARNG